MQTPNIEGYVKDYRELAARKVDVFLAVPRQRPTPVVRYVSGTDRTQRGQGVEVPRLNFDSRAAR
jgi:hypothetical protein